MNRILGFTFFLLLLAAIALILLKDMRPIAQSSARTVFTGIDWRPVSLGDETIDASSLQTLRFEDDGKLSGHGGCNRYFANYEIAESGISIGPVGATRMACPEPQMVLEQRLFDVLDRTTAIEIRESLLHLLDETGATLAVFVNPTGSDQPAAK